MGYFKEEFSKKSLGVEHPNPNNFCVSCWQRGTSPLPLLIVRSILFVCVLTIWIVSFVLFSSKFFFIYFTQWGFTVLLFMCSASTCISGLAYFGILRLTDPAFGLPWYVKAYWVLFNISAPVAFLITLFYWAVLHSSDMLVDYAPNMVLDISLHGLNSAVMLIELLTAAHPSRLLHVYQPVGFGLAYLIFGLIYYFAGGLDPWGNRWVYPVIDWSRPGATLAVVAVTTAVLVLLHGLAAGLAALRDRCAGRLLDKRSQRPAGFSNDGFVAA